MLITELSEVTYVMAKRQACCGWVDYIREKPVIYMWVHVTSAELYKAEQSFSPPYCQQPVLNDFFPAPVLLCKPPRQKRAACQMTVNSHLSCQEAAGSFTTRQVLQNGTPGSYSHLEHLWKGNFTIANFSLCCFSSINLENSSVSWAEFIQEGKCGNVFLIKCWHVEDSISLTKIKISSRNAITAIFSTLLRPVTHVSVFPLSVEISM